MLRQPAGTRNVASVDFGPVEGMGPKVGVSYDNSGFLFNDYWTMEGRRRGPVYSPPEPVLNGPTQSFIAVYEINQSSDGAALHGGRSNAAFLGEFLPRAITLYETSARYGTGEQPSLPGESLNVRL